MRFKCPDYFDSDDEDDETQSNDTNDAASIARQVRHRAFLRRVTKKKQDKRKLISPSMKKGKMLRFEKYIDEFNDELYWIRIAREREEWFRQKKKVVNPLATGLEPFFEEFIKMVHKKIYGEGDDNRDASSYVFPGAHPEIPMVESDKED